MSRRNGSRRATVGASRKPLVNLGLEDRVVPIDSIRPYPGNPRHGDIDAIRESLRTNAQYRPVVVQKSSGLIVAGNHTWMAAKEEGWDGIAVDFIECTDEEARRIVLADNRTSDLANYDDALLVDLLKGTRVAFGTFEGTGFSQRDVDRLIAKVETPEASRPQIEFSPMLFEETNYVVLFFDNSIDWQAAVETLELKPAKCWDSRAGYERTGLGRVLPGGPVIRRLNAKP